MAAKEYQFYTSRDFALDEDFQNWVLQTDIKNNSFWKAWIAAHPKKEETINQAISLVKSVHFRPYNLSSEEKDALWDSLLEKIDQEERNETTEVMFTEKSHTSHSYWKYAAAVAIVIVATFAIWKKTQMPSVKEISFSAQTVFGEKKTVMLPDSSEVILNANTRLVYNEKNDNNREVWMDGEAYFHVKHTRDNKKFIVHTYDKLSVEVLGTRFNVNSRGEQIGVVLQEGSIKLDIAEDNGNGNTQLYLKPGEIVSYNKLDGNYTKSKTDPEYYDSWASGLLMMKNYSLEDAAAFFKQVFDKKMVATDPRLMNYRISGSMPIVYDEDTMIVQFEKAFKIHFYKNGNEIRVQK